ncbi:hypothetical protein COCNU_07G013420 [Cocos nucifera]|uniref:Uncharacterized protein n=1 Tax=Cocos nucifera TaxID=13894 RepID=A0A8K0IG24_COCNU|nr:hypothetical protein COCNU_07G013420 [Cocos nucifera]
MRILSGPFGCYQPDMPCIKKSEKHRGRGSNQSDLEKEGMPESPFKKNPVSV